MDKGQQDEMESDFQHSNVTDSTKENLKGVRLKKEVIPQNTEISSSHQVTHALPNQNPFSIGEFCNDNSQNSLNKFFANNHSSQRKDYFDSSLSGSIQRNYCELCNRNILMHECGLEYDKYYLIGYISTLLNIGNNFQEVGCIYCSRSFRINTYNCANHYFG